MITTMRCIKGKGITLSELAHKLRKVFDFRYITADVHGTDSVFVICGIVKNPYIGMSTTSGWIKA